MRVFRNAFWLTLGRTVADLASFALFTVVSRTFGPSGTGEYSYAFAIGNLVGIIGSSGFDEYGIREYACASEPERPRLWRNLTAAQSPRLLLGLAFLALFLLSGFNRAAHPALIVEFSVYFIGWYLARLLFIPAMALQSMAAPALADLSCRLFAVGLAVAMVLLAHTHLLAAVLGFPIAGIALTLIALRNARGHHAGLEFTAPRAGVLSVLRGTAPFAVSDLLYQFYSRTDLLLIAFWLGAARTGLYATAVKFVEVGLIPPVLLGYAAYPVISRLALMRSPLFERSAREFTGTIFALSGWVAVGIACVLPPLIVPLLGAAFRTVIPLLAWFSVLALTKGADSAIGRLLFSVREQTWYARSLAVVTPLVVALNWLLIPRFGLRGAAIAAIASSLAGNFVCAYGLRRHLRVGIFLTASLRLSLALGCTAAAIAAAHALGAGPWARASLALGIYPLAAILVGLAPNWRHSPLFGGAQDATGEQDTGRSDTSPASPERAEAIHDA